MDAPGPALVRLTVGYDGRERHVKRIPGDRIATAHFQHRLRAYRRSSHYDSQERTAKPFQSRAFLQVLRDDRDRVHVKHITVGQLDDVDRTDLQQLVE